jgi:hypothetical protein
MFSIYLKKSHDHVVLTLCVLQGRFFTFFPKNPANYVSILMHVRTDQDELNSRLFKDFRGHESGNSCTKSWKEGVRNDKKWR